MINKPLIAAFGATIFLLGAIEFGQDSSWFLVLAASSHTEAPKIVPKLTREQYNWAITELRARKLVLPLVGFPVEKMKGSFYESRGGAMHEAVDMLAARNTAVHAVENGKVAKLFLSRLGGITIYQFDPTGRFVYYYAHLERYADNLHDGDQLRKGQVIGYVGTSGNAPPNTPHLHFSISVMNADKKYWQAQAVDPYEVFSGNAR